MAREDRSRWDARFSERRMREGDEGSSRPAAFVEGLVGRIPPGRALDLAGGGGRNAVALARAGFDVTVADVSPVGLELARERAEAAGVPIRTVEVDLDEQPPPPGPWDLILVHHFLHREVYRSLPALLAEDGMLAICHPTRKNLERHEKPSARFLLDEGELRDIFEDVSLLEYDESWGKDGRHEARLLAARSGRTRGS
jgi:tellurite methyltransferase